MLGDTTHGKGRLNELYRQRYGLDRLFLHAVRIAFAHPITGAAVELNDPLPKELAAVAAQLRAEAATSCPPPPIEPPTPPPS